MWRILISILIFSNCSSDIKRVEQRPSIVNNSLLINKWVEVYEKDSAEYHASVYRTIELLKDGSVKYYNVIRNLNTFLFELNEEHDDVVYIVDGKELESNNKWYSIVDSLFLNESSYYINKLTTDTLVITNKIKNEILHFVSLEYFMNSAK